MAKGITAGLVAAKTIGLVGEHPKDGKPDSIASILGVTSKGVFVRTASRWVIFLSSGQFHGPLTIRLDKVDPALQLLSPGDRVELSQRSISFPSIGLSISIESSRVWQPPPRSDHLLNDQERRDLLKKIAKEVNSKDGSPGLSPILPSLLARPDSAPPPGLISGFDWAELLRVRKYLHNKDIASLVGVLSNFMGLGTGLTPSGDDFILGVLLSLNRYQDLLWPVDNLPDLNLPVIQAAYQKTTSLSANLIECASLGLADERLINVLDWIVSGEAREPDILLHLMNWGHSSGLDALAGMFVTLI